MAFEQRLKRAQQAVTTAAKKCCEDVSGGPIVVESGSQKVAPHLSVTGALVESADLRMEGWTLSYRVQPGALRR